MADYTEAIRGLLELQKTHAKAISDMARALSLLTRVVAESSNDPRTIEVMELLASGFEADDEADE